MCFNGCIFVLMSGDSLGYVDRDLVCFFVSSLSIVAYVGNRSSGVYVC